MMPCVSGRYDRCSETTSASANSRSSGTRTRPCSARSGAARRVQRDHPHAEARAEPRHLHADGPEADQAQGLAAQLHPHESTGLPAALAQAHVGGADMPRGGEDHAETVLGHRGRAVVRRVGDDDAAAGRLLHVDAARVADAEEADEPELVARAQHLGVHLRVVEDHGLGRAQPLDQRGLVRRHSVVEVDRPEPPERLEVGRVLHAARAVREDDAHREMFYRSAPRCENAVSSLVMNSSSAARPPSFALRARGNAPATSSGCSTRSAQPPMACAMSA